MLGYAGKIARIELSDNIVKKQLTKKDLALRYIGGKGFGAKILFEENSKKIPQRTFENKSLTRTNGEKGKSDENVNDLLSIEKLEQSWRTEEQPNSS